MSMPPLISRKSTVKMERNRVFSFWRWFLVGLEGQRPGFRRYWDSWLLFHLVAGLIIAKVVPASLKEAASTVLLPLVAALIGLSFAWAGNAQALMLSDEIRRMAKERAGGYVEYVYAFQSAILLILLALAGWGLAGLGVFDRLLRYSDLLWAYSAIKVVFYTVSSMTIRECWHVVLGVSFLLVAKEEMNKAAEGQQKRPE